MLFQANAIADCAPPEKLESVIVAQVVDGDTLRLKDNRKLRLLNINTPELGHDGQRDEAYSREAKQVVEEWLPSNRRIFIKVYGVDRYDRQLAEVYRDPRGELLTEFLLEAGLGWRIHVPPQSRDRPCLYQAEDNARRQKRGLWSQPPLDSVAAKKADQGFRLIRGRIEEVAKSRHGIWLELEGDVVVYLSNVDLAQFAGIEVPAWQGRMIEVRGWLRSRRPPRPGLASLKMDLRHPAMIRLLD